MTPLIGLADDHAVRGLRLALLFSLVLLAVGASDVPGRPRAAGVAGPPADAVVVLEERQVPSAGRGKPVQHLVVLKNTSWAPVRELRVTVEYHDFFGRILWARTLTPVPSGIRPGETALLTVLPPTLRDHSSTRYRFHYR